MGTVAPVPPASRPVFTDVGAIFRFWDSLCVLLPKSLLAPFQTSDLNGAVSWGKVVFLASCFITMAGCGLLTSLLRRKRPEPSEIRRHRRALHRDYSKASAGTVTSSEEEDEDSAPSPRRSTDALRGKRPRSHSYEQVDDDGQCIHPNR